MDNTPARHFTDSVSNAYDYLAIGNSITFHNITDFWWTECGMAATQPEFDYYHIIKNSLGNINSGVYNYGVWEVQTHDRSETYEFLDKWLTEGIDLVTIQLSENCSDISTFIDDFRSLLIHIQNKIGGVQIIVIDDFWSKEKHDMKKTVCEELGVDFVDLSDIRGVDKYKAGIGTVVIDSEGKKHVIEHDGVAAHPGDEGMKIIAERVLKMVNM